VNFDNSVLVLKFLWYFVFLFRFCCSKITYRITKASQQQREVCAGKNSTKKMGQIVVFVVEDFDDKCLTILDCIFDRNLNRCVRPVILNLFAVLWKEHRNINILDVTPFLEGWLIRPGKCVSIRLFRQTTVVYPHRQLLCATKRFKGNDAQAERCFVIVMSNLVEFFLVVRFAFLERRRRNDFLDRRLDVCC